MGLAKDIHETKMLILDSLTNERAGGGRGGQCKKPKKKKKKKKRLGGKCFLNFCIVLATRACLETSPECSPRCI